MNLLPQTPHWWGFSPLWILLCVFRLDDVEKPFWQTSQTCGRSPVWVRRWRFRRDGLSKHFPQKSQGSIFLDLDDDLEWLLLLFLSLLLTAVAGVRQDELLTVVSVLDGRSRGEARTANSSPDDDTPESVEDTPAALYAEDDGEGELMVGSYRGTGVEAILIWLSNSGRERSSGVSEG